MDGTITRKSKDDSISTLSMKCADINLEMLNTLGVSKPILNYVIFCHQEDSNWPLDEGSKVKDKFDEIFNSAKYKDCLKEIKKVRATHMQQEKMEKKELEYMSADKKEAKQKKKSLKDKESAKKIMEDDIDTIDQEIKPIRKELQAMNEIETNYQGIKEEKASYESALKHRKDDMTELIKTIKESKVKKIFPDRTDDDDIKQMEVALQSKDEKNKSEFAKLKNELARIKGSIQNYITDGTKLEGKIGQCRGLRSVNEKNYEELQSSVQAAARKLKWTGMEGELSEQDILEFVDNIEKKVQQMKAEKEYNVKQYDQSLENRDDEIKKLRSEKDKLTEQERSKREERADTQRKIALIKRQLSELQGSDTKLKHLEEKIEDKESELQQAKNEVDISALKNKLTEKTREINELGDKLEAIKIERQKLESQRVTSTEISTKTRDQKDKQRKLDRILGGKHSELTMIFGNNLPESGNMKDAYIDKRNSMTRIKEELENCIKKLSTENEGKKNERKILLKDVALKEDRIKRFERDLQDSDLIELSQNFEDELQSAKEEIEKTRLELEVKQANKYTFQEFIDKIDKMQISSNQACCPTCNRNFDSKYEANEVKRDLENSIKRIPSKVQSIQNRLERLVKRCEKLQAMLPEKKQTDEMKVEVQQKKKDIASLDKAIKKSDDELSDNRDRLDVAFSDYSICDDLRDDVSKIDQLFREVSDLSTIIKDLKFKSPELSNSRDYDVVKKEEDDFSARINALRREKDQCQSLEIEHQTRLNSLDREKTKLLEEKIHTQKNQLDRTAIQEKKQELEASLKDCNNMLTEIDQNMQPIVELLKEADDKRKELVQEKKRVTIESDARLEEITKMQSDIAQRHQASIAYNSEGNEERLADYSSDYDKLTAKKEEKIAQQMEMETQINDLNEEINNLENERRNLNDNKKIRNNKRAECELVRKIEKIKNDMRNLDYDSNERKRGQLKGELDNLVRQRERLNGRLGQLENTIEEIEEELNSDKYRLAESNYRKKSIAARCRYHVVNDLNKYYMALEWSIMRFHQERMKVINQIIRELWRATYRGNDIDYIEIETEDGADLSNAGADKRKAVNYRVIMVKNEARLDMRGRCSAGQKVLASLIIRLALAETFSTSCGMIALDEPTTNLDRENIESLAQALADLVAKRSAQKNFQLIVITHDDDLIDQLSRMDQADYFYKVSRDEKGRSIIRRNANYSMR